MNEKKTVILLPGEMEVAITPMIINTVLGSCIAVCLWNKKTGCGGMNHYMLPFAQNGKPTLRHGDYAIKRLIEKVRAISGAEYEPVAKIFGGGNVVASITSPIGAKNVVIAKKILRENSIRIVAEDTGGINPRKISFDTETGRVQLFVPNKNAAKADMPVLEETPGRKKLLVVDEVMKRLLVLKNFLQRKGYQVFTNYGPIAAVKKGEDEKVDVVITDAGSAAMSKDGFDLCMMFRQNDALKNVRIVLHTVTEDNGRDLHDRGYGDFYLNRVRNDEDLLSQVGDVLQSIK